MGSFQHFLWNIGYKKGTGDDNVIYRHTAENYHNRWLIDQSQSLYHQIGGDQSAGKVHGKDH